MKIEGTMKGRIDCKRFYMPGITFIQNCPQCGKTIKEDMRDMYLSYAVVGKPFIYDMWCSDCDTNWEEELFIELNIRNYVKELNDGC